MDNGGDRMMGHLIIRETGPTPRIMRRERNRITTETLAAVAARHHALYMAKHFTIAGGREYGYKPRKGEGLSGKDFWKSYTGKKKKQKGHQRPMVWSGVSETLAKIRDVRASRNKARLVQHARGLNRRHPNSEIRMNEEIRTISQPEARSAVLFAGETMRAKYRDIHTTITTKI